MLSTTSAPAQRTRLLAMFTKKHWSTVGAVVVVAGVVTACSGESSDPEVFVGKIATNGYRVTASNLDPDKTYVTALCAPGSTMGFIAKEVCDTATGVPVTSDGEGGFQTDIAGRKTVKDGNGEEYKCVEADPCRIGVFDDSGILFFIHDAVWTDA